MSVKDLLNDLESGDRTVEMLKVKPQHYANPNEFYNQMFPQQRQAFQNQFGGFEFTGDLMGQTMQNCEGFGLRQQRR